MSKSAALASIVSDNPRYAAMFAVETEPSNSGVDMDRDYTPEISALRQKAPVHRGTLRQLLGVPGTSGSFDITGRSAFAFFSYRACELGFRENLLFSSKVYNEVPGIQSIGKTILSMVGKEHKRLRSAAQPLFKRPKVLDWWNKRWIEETVDVLLDMIASDAAADLNTTLCARLPMATITRAMGLEGEDVLEFRYQLTRATFLARKIDPAEAAAARAWVDAKLRELIAANQREPGDNLVAALVACEIANEDGTTRKLLEEELFGYLKLAIFAGGGTTWRQLGITIDALMTHYHFWEACRDDRRLVDLAVEEGLRWRATDPVFQRVCTADTEMFGVEIPAGSYIELVLGAANHDPEVFERPLEYDIFRKKEHHMGFGFGPHRCLGMDVARQEMIVAINALLDRFPNMRYDPARPAPRYCGLEHRGMTAVPVLLR